MEIKVDAKLIEALRNCYQELRMGEPRQLAESAAANNVANGTRLAAPALTPPAGYPREFPQWAI